MPFLSLDKILKLKWQSEIGVEVKIIRDIFKPVKWQEHKNIGTTVVLYIVVSNINIKYTFVFTKQIINDDRYQIVYKHLILETLILIMKNVMKEIYYK